MADVHPGKTPLSTSALRGHPCFDRQAHFQFGRVHLPVAPRCNLQCRYCQRDLNASEDRPGVAAGILSPEEACRWVETVLALEPRIRVIGIAGPGDPLANPETLSTLELVHARYPHLYKCVSTNGLLLPEMVDELAQRGVTHLTVTINALSAEIGRQFYSFARPPGGGCLTDAAFTTLSPRQLEGVKLAARLGLMVKVNTVLAPGLNTAELPRLAQKVASLGARMQNIIPLKPLGGMASFRAPTCAELDAARAACAPYLPQFRLCRQCRADAAGVPGEHRQLLAPAAGVARTPLYHY